MKKRTAVKRSRVLQAGGLIQSLESRMLMSVSTSNWAGPLSTGTQWTYSLAGVEGVAGTTLTSVVGSTTFAGKSATEVDQSITVTQLGISSTNLVKDYAAQTSDGFVSYGTLVTYGAILGITLPSTTITNSPAEIQIPAKMTQQVTVTQTVSQTQVTGTMSTPASVTQTLKLESETPKNRTVPAGTFSCYAIDVTTKDSSTGASVSGYNGTVYYSPGVGLVEDDETAGTTVLASFNGVAPTAGKADHLVITTEPIAVVPGATFAPPVTVQVVDALGNLVASDASEVTISLKSITGTGQLSGTLTQPVIDGIATFDGLSISSAGVYTLNVTDGSLTPEVGAPIAVSGAIGVIAPSVGAGTLKTLLTAGSTETGSVTINVTAAAGASKKGTETVQLYATDPTGKTSLVRTEKISNKLLQTGQFTVKVPVRLAHLLAGTYQFSAEEIDAAKNAVYSTSGPTVTVAPKTVTLDGSITTITPAVAVPGHVVTITLQVTNTGNFLASGTVTAGAGLSQNADGSLATNLTAGVYKVHVLPGKSQLIHIKQKVPAGSVAGSYYWTVSLASTNVLYDSDTSSNLLVASTPFTVFTQ